MNAVIQCALPPSLTNAIVPIDDIFLCAFVADRVMKEVGSEAILNRNWDGKMPVVPLVKEILDREKEL